MGEWSPSHLIVAGLALATIIGQAIAVLVRLKAATERLEKRMDKQDETIRQQGETFVHALERLEDRMDKRLSDMQAETNTRLSDIEASIRQLNQNHIDHLNRHDQSS